jgi:hypothetical protein
VPGVAVGVGAAVVVGGGFVAVVVAGGGVVWVGGAVTVTVLVTVVVTVEVHAATVNSTAIIARLRTHLTGLDLVFIIFFLPSMCK